MSHDLTIWTVEPRLPLDTLPRTNEWRADANGWSLAAGSWQLVISGPHRVEPDDMPEGVPGLLPGIGHLFELTLEPIGAPAAAYKLQQQVAKAIAKACHGVVHDPRTDTFELPGGIKRFSPPTGGTTFSVLALSWWFERGVFTEEARIGEFLALLTRQLPEALPKRYGDFEPPQHRLEETGLDHLVGFLRETPSKPGGLVVWYPSRPVVDVTISHVPDPTAHGRMGLRMHRVSLEFEAQVLEQPGWEKALSDLWMAMSEFLQPFYGDVRTLSGFERRGGRVMCSRDTELHPVRSWFWRGLPATPGHAMVLGPTYASLWPEAVAIARGAAGLQFIDAGSWRESARVPLEVPAHLTQFIDPARGDTDIARYAADFPFERPPVAPARRPSAR